MSYDIYIANKDKSKVYKLPIIPSELPSISKTIANEEFQTYDNGTFNFIQNTGLDTLTLESWLPSKSYTFAKSSYKAKDIIDLINNALKNKEFIQVVIINSNGSTYVNDKFSIESFQYHVNKKGDYNYSLGLKQYREFSKEVYVLGWNQNATGWWYCTDVANYKYYTSSWQQIDGEWYYFNASGYALASAWFLDKSIWYYLKENCKMAKSEWIKVDGKWYCFNASGGLYVDTTTPDGYAVDSNGAWIE